MPKKKTYKTDGNADWMSEPEREVELASTLKSIDDIMGSRVKINPFGTTDTDEYLKQLDEMSVVDLQKECVKHGIRPKERADFMKEMLVKAHKQFLVRLDHASVKPVTVAKPSKKVRNILEGRY